MKSDHRPQVAVLLATYNGAHFIEPQIKSLTANATPFTLHWLDDHSSDHTREAVRSIVSREGIELVEWHQARHVGLPGSFFQLLECAVADVYFFCDQDDIWQPGKIDVAFASLVDNLFSPSLCFSDSLMFDEKTPHELRRLTDFIGESAATDPMEQPMLEMFARVVAPGHTQSFTRPLRELFLKHKAIAYAYAFMHDWWIHDIAMACGTVRILRDAPSVLWRQHCKSFCANIAGPGPRRLTKEWRGTQRIRRAMARHAQGFLLAESTLPTGKHKAHLLRLAKSISTIDQRQTPAALARLVLNRTIPQLPRDAARFLIACLCSNSASSEDFGFRDDNLPGDVNL